MYAPKRLIQNLSVYLGELERLISADGQCTTAEKTKLLAEAANIKEYVGALNQLPDNHRLTAQHIQLGLALAPHPEGGFYREFIRNETCTVIFYLLPAEAISSWHSLKDTREVFKQISGASLFIPKIDASGHWRSEEEASYENDVVIEKNKAAGFGDWFGAYPNGEYGLVTCECRGPFEFAKFKIATPENLSDFHRQNPERQHMIDKLAPKSS